jgi:cellulose synthase/poly-beta-1,6-N-acetylglucosamine synthase-like glycosyltransferase
MQILFWITCFLLAAYGCLINYYFFGWLSIPSQTLPDADLQTSVTVIIPARDEETNIAACLKSVAEQTHPVQIIVINDHSTDRTAEIVASFPAKNLLLLNLADHITDQLNSYKKKAIELAVAHATGELIVCTDADCTAGPDWIRSLVTIYEREKPVFIAAPVRMKNNGSFSGIFQSLDFLSLQGITAAAVYRRIHAMSNGANLAYTKQVFTDVQGFTGADQIASGDDMLLMQKIDAKFPQRIRYVKMQQAIVSTNAETTVTSFMHQRVRWASKAGHYKSAGLSAALLLVYLTNLACGIFIIAAVSNPSWLDEMAGIILAKILAEILFVASVSRFYGQQKLVLYFPFMQPLHIFYTIIAGWLGIFGKYQWKNRKVS